MVEPPLIRSHTSSIDARLCSPVAETFQVLTLRYVPTSLKGITGWVALAKKWFRNSVIPIRARKLTDSNYRHWVDLLVNYFTSLIRSCGICIVPGACNRMKSILGAPKSNPPERVNKTWTEGDFRLFAKNCNNQYFMMRSRSPKRLYLS